MVTLTSILVEPTSDTIFCSEISNDATKKSNVSAHKQDVETSRPLTAKTRLNFSCCLPLSIHIFRKMRMLSLRHKTHQFELRLLCHSLWFNIFQAVFLSHN